MFWGYWQHRPGGGYRAASFEAGGCIPALKTVLSRTQKPLGSAELDPEQPNKTGRESGNAARSTLK